MRGAFVSVVGSFVDGHEMFWERPFATTTQETSADVGEIYVRGT